MQKAYTSKYWLKGYNYGYITAIIELIRSQGTVTELSERLFKLNKFSINDIKNLNISQSDYTLLLPLFEKEIQERHYPTKCVS